MIIGHQKNLLSFLCKILLPDTSMLNFKFPVQFLNLKLFSMKTSKRIFAIVIVLVIVTTVVVSSTLNFDSPKNNPRKPFTSVRVVKNHESFGNVFALNHFQHGQSINKVIVNASPLPEFVQTAMKYLAAAQFENGGWGSGSHYSQGENDPHAVQIDAATTAFVGMALIRSGNTHESGLYAENVKKAIDLLLEVVEKSPENTLIVIDVTNTQPQVKLGQNIDASMCSQFFSRVLDTMTSNDPLRDRVIAANEKCLVKVQGQMNTNGSVNGAGWAGVLQSSMANQAIERAVNTSSVSDATADQLDEVLQSTQDYQMKNIDIVSGEAKTEESAGVGLYSVTSTTRATAVPAKEAEDLVEKGKKDGTLKDDKVNEDNLMDMGMTQEDAEHYTYAWTANETAKAQLNDESLLSGFGNNGGEEFLSFMMTSEALVISGGEEWLDWNKKMHDRMSQVQNSDGSWSGMHCITSPVFCTAAVIMTLTADRDANFLMKTVSR